MSEQGWRDFLAADGVDDWVVLDGGAMAVFRVVARLEAALAAGGRIVDESHAPSHWTLADRAGNRGCICAWPDGAPTSPSV